MLYALTGTIRKLQVPQVTVDVNGVAYLVTVPAPVWDALSAGSQATLTVYTYVREDRLDLFGFLEERDRSLFTELLNLNGVGPKIALELCAVPRNMLYTSVNSDDVSMLSGIKGIGKKTAEKLLVDLKSLFEKHPEWLTEAIKKASDRPASFDADAIAALTSLGYDQATVSHALKNLSPKLKKTEERVAAALRSL
jgi:Holliday junction DNA helicase RuvA